MRIASLLLASAGVFALAGCSSGPPTGDVAGTVTYDAVPIADGSITFHPADGKGPTTGGPIKHGKFFVEKVPVGTAKVQITSNVDSGKKKKMYNTPNSPEYPIMIDPLPAKYNDPLTTELRFDVQSGQNEKNWDLKK